MSTEKTFRIFVTTLYQGEYRVRTSNNPNYLKVLAHAGFEDTIAYTFDEEITKAAGVAVIRELEEFNTDGSRAAFAHYDNQIAKRTAKLEKARAPKGTRGRKPRDQDDPLLAKASAKAKTEQDNITVDSIMDDPILAMAAMKARKESLDKADEDPEVESIEISDEELAALEEEPF